MCYQKYEGPRSARTRLDPLTHAGIYSFDNRLADMIPT